MSSHTWRGGDCFNNPKNESTEGQNIKNCNMESHSGHGYYYLTRGWGWDYRCGCGSYKVPCLTNPFPTLFIQQAPTIAPPNALSTVTNTHTYSVIPIQTYIVIPMNIIRGEKNSQRLYNKVVYCKAVYINDIHCCETAADAKMLPTWHCNVQILILIISIHVSILRMEL